MENKFHSRVEFCLRGFARDTNLFRPCELALILCFGAIDFFKFTAMSKTPLNLEELNELTAGLNKLALNLWWTFDQEAQEIFQELSPRSWQNLYHNAVAVLHEVSDYELRVRLQDFDFACRVRGVLKAFNAYLNDQNTWVQRHAPSLAKNGVAYFSAEFGFHETLPIAAGGLGILAGDHAKSASDIGLGFSGISLFYREGYFQQAFNQDNWQTEYYTLLNPKNLPIEPVLDAKGEQLVCSVEITMNQVFFQVWRVNVGRNPVYLLDTNRPGKSPAFSGFDFARVLAATAPRGSCRRFLLGVGGVPVVADAGCRTPRFTT